MCSVTNNCSVRYIQETREYTHILKHPLMATLLLTVKRMKTQCSQTDEKIKCTHRRTYTPYTKWTVTQSLKSRVTVPSWTRSGTLHRYRWLLLTAWLLSQDTEKKQIHTHRQQTRSGLGKEVGGDYSMGLDIMLNCTDPEVGRHFECIKYNWTVYFRIVNYMSYEFFSMEENAELWLMDSFI